MASWWKVPVSLFLVWHFIAILSGVVAVPGPNQLPPILATKVNQFASPYLDALLLNSSFRFYAPNPGPARLTWYRVERVDGKAEWYEMPGFDAWPTRSIYQRGLSLSSFLDTQLGPDSKDPKRLGLSPAGVICVASFVRKLTRQFDLPANRITTVELYTVHHKVLEPDQIASGWKAYDLRLYRPCCLGRFAPNGLASILPSNEYEYPFAVESSRLGARMCVDLANNDPASSLKNIAFHWPRPLRELLPANPDLVSVSADENELKGRIERLALASSTANTTLQSRITR